MSENSLARAWQRSPSAVVRAWHEIGARQTALLMVGSVVCGAALLFGRLNQGWWHHDDGSLAHSAQRVLAGELPHRDFAELYTGMLTFANAAVFALLGEDIFNLRVPLFALFLVFIGCFFAIARRLISPGWAFVATLAAITWSVPVYPAPMPSWYLLFFSTIGTYGVVRFFEARRRRWLLLAGICGGIGVTIKFVGIWYVVAVVLALLAETLVAERDARSDAPASRMRGAVAVGIAVLAFGLVTAVLSGHVGAGEIANLFVPVVMLCGAVALLGVQAWGNSGDGSPGTLRGDLGVLLASTLAPVALLVTPYVATASIGDLVEGVFIAPRARFEFASWSAPSPASLLWAVPVVVVFVLRAIVSEQRRLLIDVVASSGVVFLVLTATTQPSYSLLWDASRALAPLVIVAGAVGIVRRSPAPMESRAPALLLVLVAGFSTLLQFPFAAPIYFCYVAPLVLLAAIAVLRSVGAAEGVFPCTLLLALAVFGFRQLDHQSVLSLGFGYVRDPQVAVLDGERATIRVLPATKRDYERVLPLVAKHRPSGGAIFAGPDAPEIYFLTQSRNPTPSILDFLDVSGSTRGNKLIRLLDHDKISVIVLNHLPEQSPPLDPATVARIRSLYVGSERVGRFEVRWRSKATT